MFLSELEQQPRKHAVFTFGRLNPPHYGHHAMIKTLEKVARENNADWYLFVSSKQEPEKNPLSYEQKTAWIKALFPETVGHLVEDSSIKTPLVAATWLYKKGYRSITFVAGEDDMESYSKMIQSGNEHGKKNPDAVAQGKGFIFDPIDFAISPRLASATNARAAVQSGDAESFARAILGPKITDIKLLNAVQTQLYPTVRKAMNLGESTNLKKKLLDKPTPTVGELAEKYKTSLIAVELELERGIKVEMEHTNDEEVAKEIALDHLNEKLDYYKELAKIEEVAKVRISKDPKDFGAYVTDVGEPEPTVMLDIRKINQVLEPDDLHQTKLGAPEKISQMVKDIRKGDKLPPILVRRQGNGYQVLDGHHRFKAFKLAKVTKVPVRIVDPKNISVIKKEIKESNLRFINQQEEGGSLEGYVVDTSAPQLTNYLTSQGADARLATAIASKFSTIAIIKNMYVDDESRGKGIGSQLLESAIDEAFAYGAEAIVLVADMAEDNQALGKSLDQWYASYGFTKIGMAGSDPVMILTNKVNEAWTKKYKKSIDCNNPKGFSQRAHCAGRKARRAGEKTKSKSVSENFTDGKGPGRPGDSARHGIPKGATITQLEKHAKRPGRAGQLARWQLNMRRGKAKANEEVEIDEASMSAGALADFAKSEFAQSLTVGFEAEMVYPNLEPDDGLDRTRPDLTKDEDFPVESGWKGALRDFFTSGDVPNDGRSVERVIDDIESIYLEWVDEWFDDWLETDKAKKLAEKYDIDYKLAKNKDDQSNAYYSLQLRFRRLSSTLRTFVEEAGLETMSGIWNRYRRYIDWPYPTTSDITAGPRGLANSLAKSINVKTTYSQQYHGATRDSESWIFEPDSSIRATNGGMGLELVSPPMPFPEAMTKLNQFFDWAQDQDAYTNKTTGFHVGVSIPNQTMDNIDHLKLVLFLGDQYVLNQFGRAANTYAESFYSKMTDYLNLGNGDISPLLDKLRQGIKSLAFAELRKQMVNWQQGDRYVSVNIKDNYIEFRSAGGDYIKNVDKIKNTILRYVRAMGIAADPEAYKQEYAKKSYQLLSTAVKPNVSAEISKAFDRYVSGAITRSELKQLLIRLQSKRKMEKGDIPGEGPNGPGTYIVTYRIGSDTQQKTIRNSANRADAWRRATEMLHKWAVILKVDRFIKKTYRVTYDGDYAFINAKDEAEAITKARTFTFFGTGSTPPDSDFKVDLYSEESVEQVNEVANQPYRFLQAKKTATSNVYIFMNDAGSRFAVDVEYSPASEMIEIGFADQTDRENPTISLTGKGDAFRIFATVAAIVQDYMSKSTKPVNQITFKGKVKDPSRIKLYDAIAKYLPKVMPGFELMGAGADSEEKQYFFKKTSIEETLKKVKGKWALVSRHNPKKVLQYYKGSGHPSKEWVNKVERRVHSFEAANLDEAAKYNMYSGISFADGPVYISKHLTDRIAEKDRLAPLSFIQSLIQKAKKEHGDKIAGFDSDSAFVIKKKSGPGIAVIKQTLPDDSIMYKITTYHPNLKYGAMQDRVFVSEMIVSEEDDDQVIKPIVYLDMDGVLADFFGEWAKLDGKDHYKDIENKEAALQMVREHPSFWVDLPLLPNAKNLIRTVVEHFGEYRVCTKPLEGDPRCKLGKMQWIKDNLSDMPPVEIIITEDKSKYATPEGTPAILVDDYGVNINAWRNAGGIGIKYEDPAFNQVKEILVRISKSGVVK